MIDQWQFLVLGVGGLGCPALLGLVAAGARSFFVVDHDRVETSNLHRQVLFTPADVGRPKVEAAHDRLLARRADLTVEGIDQRLDPASLADLVNSLGPRTAILECTDSPTLKFAANDLCVARQRPLVIGAALGWAGQVVTVAQGHACYRCVFEEPPPVELAPDCASAGVLGPVTGVIGVWMATLAVSLVAQPRQVAGHVFAFDLLHGRIQHLSPAPRPDCHVCALTRPATTFNPGTQPMPSTQGRH